jgi:anti-sigma B factor antagonist
VEISEEKINEICLLKLKGRLDFQSAKKIKEYVNLLAKKKLINIIIDMEHIYFIDRLGIGSLVACLHLIKQSGGDIKIVSLQEKIRMIFELTRIYRIFKIFNDLETAVKNS